MMMMREKKKEDRDQAAQGAVLLMTVIGTSFSWAHVVDLANKIGIEQCPYRKYVQRA